MKLVAIVMTLNEARHLPRCLSSLRGIADAVMVVDSFSTDETVRIAREHGAKVLQRAWVNHSEQFNWALTRLDADTDWVLRVDADERLTPELAAEIRERLPGLDSGVNGVAFRWHVVFQGRAIRFGGVSRAPVLRLFRYGHGRCESRWMDEHIKGAEPAVTFRGELIDENLKPLTWWIDKHNRYASLEATDLLNLEYGFWPRDSIAGLRGGARAGANRKRWVKERVYARLPRGMRALAYFLYCYVFRLGMLDGPSGAGFHVLRGFWYRYLVDAKIAEVKRCMRDSGVDAATAVDRILGIDVRGDPD